MPKIDFNGLLHLLGPDGGSPEKPVGLVWIALNALDFKQAWRYQWQGDRLSIKEQSACQALRLLIEYLKEFNPHPAFDQSSYGQPVEVTAHFDQNGQARPLGFIWQNREIAIGSLGRRWNDAFGQHILVMDQAERVYELAFSASDATWYARRVEDRRAKPI